MSQIKNKFVPNLELNLIKLNQTGATTGQIIRWNGSAWVPYTEKYISSTNATQSVATVTPTTLTQLTTASLPIGLYKWTMYGIAKSTALATGIGLRLVNGTATVGFITGRWNIVSNADGTSKFYGYDQLATTTNLFANAAVAANTDFTANGEGIINITAAGTLNVELRSENATSVSIRANSYLILERLS